MCHTAGCNGPALGQQQQHKQERDDDGDCCRRRRRWWWRGTTCRPTSTTTATTTTTTTTTATTTIPSSEAEVTVMVDITSNRSSTTCASIQQHRHHHYHQQLQQLPSSSSSSSSSSSLPRSNTDRINSLSCRNNISNSSNSSTSSSSSSREAHITSVVASSSSSSSSSSLHDRGGDRHCCSLCTQDCSGCCCCCWKGGGGVDGGGTRLQQSSNYNSSSIATATRQHPVPTTTSSYLATSSSSISSYSATVRSLLQLSLQQCVFTVLLLCLASFSSVAECCSSRSTPKPRPPSPTTRPNVTFLTYACPPAYAAWYCLNGATCFTVKIGDSILYNCECADGYMGQRCEFKDLDGSYLPAREKVLLETASIAGGATVATVLVFVVLFALYVIKQRDKEKRDLDETSDRRPFSGYQSTRPETFHTISNPYARTAELSHVEVVGPSVNTGAAVSSSASCSSLHSPS